MACYHPIGGYQKLGGGFTTSPQKGNGNPMTVPCGRCIGCRLAHGLMWKLRMVHESRFHDATCFLTLTYSNEHLPRSGQLVKKHVQDFLKRLRYEIRPIKIRYYCCGEYGEQSLRPHYHLIVYGYRPDDLQLYKPGEGQNTYTSERIERVWGLGFVTVGDVTPETCAYTARYVTKKISGAQAETHYQRLHTDTGEVVNVPPEFSLMSRRPGIGASYFSSYFEELMAHDHVVDNGHPTTVPRYYDKLAEKYHLPDRHVLKHNRQRRAKEIRSEQTPERLATREECTLAKTRHYQRGN